MECFGFSLKKARALYFPVFFRRFFLLGILSVITYLPHLLKYSRFEFATFIAAFFMLAFVYNLLWIFQKMRMYSTFYITVNDNKILYYCEQGHRFMSKCVCQIDHFKEIDNKKMYIKLYAKVEINYADEKHGHYGTLDSIQIPKVFDNFDLFINIINGQLERGE